MTWRELQDWIAESGGEPDDPILCIADNGLHEEVLEYAVDTVETWGPDRAGNKGLKFYLREL